MISLSVVPGLPVMRRFKSYVGIKRAFKKFQKLQDDFTFMKVAEADALMNWEQATILKLKNLKY